jgi:polysaccharide export outer membrane protein
MDLYSNPDLDIALRPGDIITVERDARAFTALGATGSQSRVPFETETLSAIEAIAIVGGLNTSTADPTGVFVFRNEPAEIANAVLGRKDLQGDQRMIYVLDLTQPTGMFEARDFLVRDGDTVYVTEAPFVQWQKTLTAITGTSGAADTLATTATGG